MNKPPTNTDAIRLLSNHKTDAIGNTAGRLAILKAAQAGVTDLSKLRAAARAAK